MTARAGVTPAVSRFDGVDVLRGLSILAVVMHHTWLRFLFGHVLLHAGMSRWLRHLLFQNGNNGVTVFFAVSGFLITLTSLRRFGSLAAMRARVFYRIRFARIAPLLLAVLAVLSLLHLLHVSGFVIKNVSLPRALLSALTFHLNWLEAKYNYLPANWDVLWSLSVEEMFYLFFPLVCLLLLRWRRGMGAFLFVLAAFVVMGPFARTVWTSNEIWQEKTYLGGMDAIALGCLTALFTAHLQRPERARPLPDMRTLAMLQAAGVALMALILAWPTWEWYRPAGRVIGKSGLDGTILALGTCCVICATVLRGSAGTRWTAGVRWFGRHSYEVYLTHEFLVIAGTELFFHLHRGSPWLYAIAIVALTAPLGWAVARWLSEPANRALRGAPPAPTHA